MLKIIKKNIPNIILLFSSFFLTIILLEFFIFRFILPAPDIPKLDFVNTIIKYKPYQKGTFRVKNEIKSNFKINAVGWNSIHNSYAIAKKQKYRVAIIGDSYVEALQVNYDKSLAEQLEKNLGENNYEVYRFGISGAPLSQYLHILRKEVAAYNPDLVVIVVVHNDINESYKFKPGVYTSSFLKIKIEDDVVSGESIPKQFQKRWYSVIRNNSATWKYLVHRQKVNIQPLRNLILKKNKEKYQANISVSNIVDEKEHNKIVTDYILREMKEFADIHNIKLLLVMDGNRNAIYNNLQTDELYKSGALVLNKIVEKKACKNNISFIDLHPIFKKDFAKNKKRFNFKEDAHWNIYGHSVVANVVSQYIRDNFGQ